MKPYPHRGLSEEQRIYNYRISRARRVVENAFGILANRFRVFLAPIHLEPPKVEQIVQAACALHNFLREKIGKNYEGALIDKEIGPNHDFVPGAWRTKQQMGQAPGISGTNQTKGAKQLREHVCAYVNSPRGAVAWQWDKV